MKEILDVIHKTIYQFFDACEDDEEVPMSDKDKLLLEVNKAICNNLKAFNVLDINDGELISRQPEERTEERTGTHACDCISRAEVLSTYADWHGYGYNNGFYRLVQQMKSVEPERKHGKWKWDQRTGEYECSECGCNPIYERTTPDVSEIDKYRYCRWCGAKMEGTDG